MMNDYELLSGDRLVLAALSDADRAFLDRLDRDAREKTDYFELLRRVKGPEAYPLRNGRLTPEIARGVLYRVAHDVADRAGIEQGYVLAPDVDPRSLDGGADLLSLTEAAALIGITRAAAHQAIVDDRLRATRIGNAWIVRSADARAYKEARARGPSSTSPGVRAAAKNR